MNSNGISDTEKKIINAIEKTIVFNETGEVICKKDIQYRDDMPNLENMYIGELLEVAEAIGVEVTTKMSIPEIKDRLKREFIITK